MSCNWLWWQNLIMNYSFIALWPIYASIAWHKTWWKLIQIMACCLMTPSHYLESMLTHWGRVTHICISKLTIIASDNGLSPGRHQAIIWTNAAILLIGPLRTNFNEILIENHIISFKKIHLKMSSGKRRPSCLGLNVLTNHRRGIVASTKGQFHRKCSRYLALVGV